jgi:arylsulfatase A-like enzyme
MELSDEPGCYEDAYRAWVRKTAPDQLDNISLGLPPATQDYQRLIGFSDGIKHPRRLFGEWGEFPGDENVTHSGFVGSRTVEYLRSRHDAPFFCFASFYSPHEPFVAPRKYLDLYDVNDMPSPRFPTELSENRSGPTFTDEAIRANTRAYYAMISEVDAWIGRIMDAVEAAGIAENTVIAFTSDHGEFLGEQMRYGKGPWAPDVISRVPLIISVPESHGGAKARQVIEVVECVDILPTLLDAAGIQIPPDLQGDLLPVTCERTTCAGDGLGLTEWHGGRSLRLASFRYVAEAGRPERLFDLNADPFEYHNVAADAAYADALSTARTKLIDRMIRIEQPLTAEWPY